jgi:hypothetical protein
MIPVYRCPPEPLQICPKSKFFSYSVESWGEPIEFEVDDEVVESCWYSCLCHADPAKRKVMCCVAEVEWTERAERLRDVQAWMQTKHEHDCLDVKWFTWSIRFGYKAADAEYQAQRWREAGNE